MIKSTQIRNNYISYKGNILALLLEKIKTENIKDKESRIIVAKIPLPHHPYHIVDQSP
jgi:hypothetical protein